MKRSISKMLLAAAALSATAAFAASKSEAPRSTATAQFHESEKFTDFKTSDNFPDDADDRAFLEKRMVEQLDHAVAGNLPGGYRLSVRFTDIDLAGDFDPWKDPAWHDIRMMRDIYPPRLKFSFELADPSGAVVASGDRKLSDLSYMNRVRMRSPEITDIEGELLRDFVGDLARDLRRKS